MREILIEEIRFICGGGDNSTATGGANPTVSCPAGYVPVVVGGGATVTYNGISVGGGGYLVTCYPA